MPPSSRTPEGEPLRCPICGASQRVDVSRPPGDCVCASCGALAWIGPRVDSTGNVRAAIEQSVEELSQLCRRDVPVEQIGDVLVKEVTHCLAAHGAMLWLVDQTRRRPRGKRLRLVAATGRCDDTPRFAEEVSETQRDELRKAIAEGQEVLLIGAPVVRNSRVAAVIEVLQRTGSRPTAQRGYLRFVRKVAEIFAGCSALSMGES